MVAKISMVDLHAMLGDIDVPDARIGAFLTVRPDLSSPFGPVAVPDPEKVSIDGPLDAFQAQAAIGTNLLSSWARWRRQRRFDRDLDDQHRPIVYAEGDSWLQFPFLIEDLVDHLATDHLVWCTSKPGDTLANMVFGRNGTEYIEQLHHLLIDRRLPVGTFLFSGAGNDVVGEDAAGRAALGRVVRPYDPARGTAWHIATPELIDTLALIESAYVKVLEDVERHFPERQFPDLRVVIHGYDHAPTRSLPQGDPKRPVWARNWTGTPLGALGFPDNTSASRVVAAVVDRVNALTARVCAAFPRAVFADLRGSVPPDEWADELHPTGRGFAAAAKRLRMYL
jgi:hypothetical protein